jgi:hypothetical protein
MAQIEANFEQGEAGGIKGAQDVLAAVFQS